MFAGRRLALVILVFAALGCDTMGSGDATPRASGDMEASAPVVAPSHGTGDSAREPAAGQPSSVPATLGSEDANDAASAELSDPGTLERYRGRHGESLRFPVTGSVSGSVWGTDVYSDDSDLATAAVHAGKLIPGETGVVEVVILPGQDRYAPSERNGVRSLPRESWGGSFVFAGTVVEEETRAVAAAPEVAMPETGGAEIMSELEAAETWSMVAKVYAEEGDHAEAEPMYLHALELIRNSIGEERSEYALILYELAEMYWEQARYDEAETMFSDALELLCTASQDIHSDCAMLLNNLGVRYHLQARYADAENLLIRAAEIPHNFLGEDTPKYPVNLYVLAEFYQSLGRYADAEPVFLRMLEVVRAAHGEEHPEFAAGLQNLAVLYVLQARYAEAEPLYLQALEITRAALGEHHPDYATSLNNLAALYRAQSRYAEAEPLFLQALEIRRSALGEVHPDHASVLNNLGQLYTLQGRYAEAKPLLLQALEIRRAALGEEHLDYGIILNELAALYRSLARYADAESYLLRALEITRAALGEHHPDYATSLNNLASVYTSQGRDVEAVSLYLRALVVLRAALGGEHPNYAASLHNLAGLYRSQARYADAESLYLQAINIFDAALMEDHPYHVSSLHRLAFLYWTQGRSSEALAWFSRDLSARRGALSRMLIGLTESGRSGVYGQLAKPDTYASASVWLAEEGLDGASLGLDAALLFKGLLSEVSGQERSWGVAEGSAGWQEAHAAHRSLSGEAAALRGRLVEDPGNTELRERLAAAEAGVAEAERRLASESAVFARERRLATATWREVSAALGPGRALLEYVRYREVDPASGEAGEARYVVYALRPGGRPPVLVDLGPAEPVDAAVGRWRGEMEAAVAAYKGFAAPDATAEASLGEAAAALHGLLLAPVLARAEIAAGTHLVVGPDGPLSFLPFEALVSGTGADGRPRYVVEDHPVSYVVSGREIAVWGMETEAAQSPALVLGNPDYALASVADEALGAHVAAALSRLDREGAGAPPGPAPGGAGPRMATAGGDDGACWPASGWEELPGFGTGVSAVAGALGAAGSAYLGPFTGGEALEELVKRTPGPEVLAIATHGYHCDTDAWARRLESAGARRGPGAGFGEEAGVALPAEENPLLRSGLVLAGGNTLGSRAAGSGVEDGNLTALEVASLNLHGTRLVSLVACVTGLGEAPSGSGVVGLRSAFRRAGAQTLQMSLFEVPLVGLAAAERERRAARGFLPPDGSAYVERFFAGWRPGKAAEDGGGLSRVAAHHAAQRALLATARTPGHPDTGGVGHPLWWAAFALVGDPGE